MLESGALSDPGFPDFAKSVVLYLHNTSRVEGVKYDDLLRVKGFRGFPTLAFMDAEGEVLTSQVPRSVSGFQQTAAALSELGELRKAEKEGKLAGDAAARLLLAQIDLGTIDSAEAKARAAAIEGPVSKENKEKLDARLLDLEIAAIFAKHQQESMGKRNELSAAMRPADGAKPTDEQRKAAAAAMTEVTNAMEDAIAADLQAIVERKQAPSDKGALRFWSTILRSAQRRHDAAMIERAKAELAKLAEREPAMKDQIDRILNPPAAGTTTRQARPAAGAEKKG